MNYNPAKNVIQITPEEAKRAYEYLRAALKHIRKAADLPLDRYSTGVSLTSADLAQSHLLSAAECLGIDMGAAWGNELDLRDVT